MAGETIKIRVECDSRTYALNLELDTCWHAIRDLTGKFDLESKQSMLRLLTYLSQNLLFNLRPSGTTLALQL